MNFETVEIKSCAMSKPILVVTYRLTEPVEERIAREFVSRYPEGAPFTTEELLAAAEGADALLVTSVNKLDASFFARVSSSVKVIATFSVGYEHIDLAAAARAGDSDCEYAGGADGGYGGYRDAAVAGGFAARE